MALPMVNAPKISQGKSVVKPLKATAGGASRKITTSARNTIDATPTGIASVAQTITMGMSKPNARHPPALTVAGGLIKWEAAALKMPAIKR